MRRMISFTREVRNAYALLQKGKTTVGLHRGKIQFQNIKTNGSFFFLFVLINTQKIVPVILNKKSIFLSFSTKL